MLARNRLGTGEGELIHKLLQGVHYVNVVAAFYKIGFVLESHFVVYRLDIPADVQPVIPQLPGAELAPAPGPGSWLTELQDRSVGTIVGCRSRCQ